MMAADVAIVGAGSAGSVLAARLTEDAGRNVVLLEAGPDYQAVAEQPPTMRARFASRTRPSSAVSARYPQSWVNTGRSPLRISGGRSATA